MITSAVVEVHMFQAWQHRVQQLECPVSATGKKGMAGVVAVPEVGVGKLSIKTPEMLWSGAEHGLAELGFLDVLESEDESQVSGTRQQHRQALGELPE